MKGVNAMNEKLEIVIDHDAKEPSEYFKILKSSALEIDMESLKGALEVIATHILKAKSIGQDAFVRKLAFTGDILLKEQILFTKGIKRFVLMDDIKKYIDKVKPEGSIKIIELERYPRAIPIPAMEAISEAQALNLFTDYCVVFTDFTNQNYQSKEDKEYIRKNRDPVVFGYFMDNQTDFKHDRFYMIADWEDEHCHLTFSELMQKMQDGGIKNPCKTISQDAAYIQGLIGTTLKETEKKPKEKDKQNFWDKFLWLLPKK